MEYNIKPPSWASEGPMDFEYRSYKMLSELESLRTRLESGELFSVLLELDDILDYLYAYDADRLYASGDLSNYTLTGIDWDNFNLEFSDEVELNRDSVMDRLCDEAIDKFENLHEQLREEWRFIENGITASWVPTKPYIAADGFVFIKTPDNMLHTYYFHKPNKYTTVDWKSFKLEKLQTQKYTDEIYFKHVDELIEAKSDKIIIKVTCKSTTRLEDNAIAVIQQVVYTMLRKGFSF